MQGPGSLGVVSQVIIGGGPNSGLFLYNGAPGFGNPPVVYAIPPGGPTHDPYGNPIGSPIFAVQGSPSSGSLNIDSNANIIVKSPSGIPEIYTSNGTTVPPGISAAAASGLPMEVFYNSFGAVLMVVCPDLGGLFQYNDTGSATQGGIIGIQSSKNTHDPVFNLAQTPGVTVVDPVFGDFMSIVGSAINIGIASAFLNNAQLVIVGGGVPASAIGPSYLIRSPAQTTTNRCLVQIFGESTDGTVSPGQVMGAASGASPTLVKNTNALLELQSSAAVSAALALVNGTNVTAMQADPTSGELTVNNSVDGNTYSIGLDCMVLTTAQLVNSVTPATIGPMSIHMFANTRYRIHGEITYLAAIAAGAGQLSWASTAAMTLFAVKFVQIETRYDVTSSAGVLGNTTMQHSRADVFQTATFTIAGNTIEIDGFINSGTTQTISLQAACTVAADTWTIAAGSFLEIHPV